MQIIVDENEPYGADADTVIRNIRRKAIPVIMGDVEPDADLLKILDDRIVTLAPDMTAVDQAVADILNLAKKRAGS